MAMGKEMFLLSSVLLLFCMLFQVTSIGASSATLSLGQSLSRDETLISEGGEFELGFFSPGNSSDTYVGIWYKKIPVRTVVWVLNRDSPILHSGNNASLMLSGGNLQLFNGARETVWALNVSTTGSNTTEATLLDNGNFVLKNDVFIYWQSFDYPTDTLLPGMKFGFDETSGKNITVVSWRNLYQPQTGLFSLQADPSGNGEFFMRKNGSQTFWRSGPWDAGSFPFIPSRFRSDIFNFSYDGKYLAYNVVNDSIISRIVMDPSGLMQLLVWTESNNSWNVFSSIPSQQCEVLGACGPYGVCDINNSPVCACLRGFVPNSLQSWALRDFSGGCVRKSSLNCSGAEDGLKAKVGFLKISNVRWPASSQPLELGSIRMCEILCIYNCSCDAYALSNNGRCLFWNKQLLDLESLPNGSAGRDLYIKYPNGDIISSPIDDANPLPATGHKKSLVIAITVSIATVIFVCCTCLCYIRRRNLNQKGVKETNQNQNLLLFDLNGRAAAANAGSTVKDSNGMARYKNYELPMFSFASVVLATDNFSIDNKLGEGGFGPVYKGKLLNGQLVAVKRLSKRSGQGLQEFRNETELIAELQHRNLVRILGCCIEMEEMILIYEYMPNRSLDSFLFVPTNQELLDWARRVHIIEGIAQGLLYLHQYSRLRIVHRDLKASNILLDGEMNPKISDFGLARIFGGNDLQANTDRIVGTYGYMSPEYAMEGLFSVKSDVFAFGVLLLEILSGKKNTGFYGEDCLSLLGHAWELWKNGRVLELLDPVLEMHSFPASPERYIVIGLLCVQETPADRPIMSEVVAMLSNNQAILASPKQPAFTARTVFDAEGRGGGEVQICSANNLTISAMEPR